MPTILEWKQGPAHCILCGHTNIVVAPFDVVQPFECSQCGEMAAVWDEEDVEIGGDTDAP